MSIKKIVFLILIFFSGIIFYGFYNDLIIIRLPYKNSLSDIKKSNDKRLTKFLFYSLDKWHSEETEIIWSENIIENINNILTNWFSFNYEIKKDSEKIPKQVNVQTIILSSNKNFAYISFDKNPLNKQWPIYQKIKFIESILKTLNENKIKLNGIYFLVNHKFLEDAHLDFSHAWPLTGYSEVS